MHATTTIHKKGDNHYAFDSAYDAAIIDGDYAHAFTILSRSGLREFGDNIISVFIAHEHERADNV